MLAALRHRGPDGSREEVAAAAAFGVAWLDLHDGEADPGPWRGGGGDEGETAVLVADATIFAPRSDWRGPPAPASISLAHIPSEPEADLVRVCAGLEGDYALALWRPEERRLQLARDRLGMRPLFYAYEADRVLFASDPRAILAAGLTSREIDRSAAVEMLLLGAVREAGASIFRRIRRVPPGHVVSLTPGGATAVAYRHPRGDAGGSEVAGSPVTALVERATRAVADRVGDAAVGARVSGGLDSCLVAALADRVLAERGVHPPRVTGVAAECPDWAHGDWAVRLEALPGVQIERVMAGTGSSARTTVRPQPVYESWPGLHEATIRSACRRSRRILTGQGGDLLTSPEPTRFPHLLATFAWPAFVREALTVRSATGRWPPLHIRSWLLWQVRNGRAPRVPAWITPEAARETGLEDRLVSIMGSPPDIRNATGRPHFRHYASAAYWQTVAEIEDPASVGVPAIAFHPLLDPRLLELAGGLPAVPWSYDKYLLRAAGKDLLPEELRMRPKTTPRIQDVTAPLEDDDYELLRRPWAVEEGLVDARELEVRVARYRAGEITPATRTAVGHTLALERWLLATGDRWQTYH
jgi:hypothetical protein